MDSRAELTLGRQGQAIARSVRQSSPASAASKPPGGWLGSGADEGRGKQRYARGRRMQPLNPGFPNGNSRYRVKPCSIRETQVTGEYRRGTPRTETS